MRDVNYEPGIRYLLALAADPDVAPELLQPVLADFDTRDSCIALGVATARAIAARTPYTPRQTGPLTTSEIAALVLVSKARKRPQEIPQDLAELPSERLGDVTIALLQVWRIVASADVQRWTDALQPSERRWDAFLSHELGGSDHPDRPTPQTGSEQP